MLNKRLIIISDEQHNVKNDTRKERNVGKRLMVIDEENLSKLER